mgnify:CR=1 FL=1
MIIKVNLILKKKIIYLIMNGNLKKEITQKDDLKEIIKIK